MKFMTRSHSQFTFNLFGNSDNTINSVNLNASEKSNIIINFVPGMIASTITYPINTYVIKYQVKQKYNLLNSKNIFQDLSKGFPMHLTVYTLFWGICFNLKKLQLINNVWNKISKNSNNMIKNIGVTYTAANIASFITNPLWIIKIRQQTLKPILDNKRTFYGFGNPLKGFTLMLLYNFKIGLQLPFREYLSDKKISKYIISDQKTKSSKIINQVSSSVIIGFIGDALFYPMSTLCSRIRIGKETFGKAFYKNLYNGFIANNIKSVFYFTIMMSIKDYLIN